MTPAPDSSIPPFPSPPSWKALESALDFAIDLHAGQTRKGSGAPYVSHLLSVAGLVLEHGGDPEQTIAALLHDAAEDHGGHQTVERIRNRFGNRVARMVADCTDTFERPKPPWRERKEAYLARIPAKPLDSLLVVCSDKLHNARSILSDYRTVGEAVFERFRGGRDGTLWYYQTLATNLAAAMPGHPLPRDLAAVVTELTRLCSGPRTG